MNSIYPHPISRLLLVLLLAGWASAASLPVRILSSWQEGLRHPSDLAVDARGKAWVVDGLNRRLLVLAPGKEARRITLPEFRTPLGVAIREGEVLVSDPDAGSLFLLGLDGSLKKQIPLPSVCDPVDVAFLEDLLLVSDNDNHRLLVLDREGRIHRSFGKDARDWSPPLAAAAFSDDPGRPGSLAGEFTYPGMITAYAKGMLVVDVLGGRVQDLTLLGAYKGSFGTFGTAEGELYRPKGCARLADGQVLVSDGYTGIVYAYNGFAEPVGALALDGKPWRMEGPTAIVAAEEGRCWFVDSRDSTVYLVDLPAIPDGRTP